MNYDLLIKNGNIIDPSQNINKVSDLAIKDGKIADIQDVIDYKLAKEVIDAKGKIVSPGLIDLHVHSFWGGSIYGIDPDLTLISKGVTTALDAGSTGSVNFPTSIYENHPSLINELAQSMLKNSIKPEIEIFDLAMLYNAFEMVKEGLLLEPIHVQFVFGIKNALPAKKNILEFQINELKKYLPQ